MNKAAFLELLPTLGFVKRGGLLVKEFGPARLTVDVAGETLVYPEDQGLVVNERQTCHFKADENFVVFECVHRLLAKGYEPRHLELEPKWKLGHDAKSGRADILIKDNAGRALLIIECKTAGKEFTRAWKDTLHDGGQLFSYLQQVNATQFLCLYASEFVGGAVRCHNHIITHCDNEKYLAENPTLKSFGDATDVRSRFAVWRDTYKLDSRTAGIFEDNIQPYHIGKDKYSLADLHPISADDQQKKYHEFATILRQHNVSGRENAFDKLVNLFLCKLVDESQHPDDLKFYWKGIAYDTPFQLIDRLQQLYQAGMEKFLGEKITYIAEGDVRAALRFVRHSPDATQRAVWKLFIQQKFFTNNDFSFIDVHNEKLFYQNAEVLLKILQMWQDIRLAAPDAHNQFLGDMFEFFLDQGVKQTEGQFFTPGPICRFMLMSLPLEAIVSRDAVPPKAMDYACGAGHFLTELARQLRPLVERHHPTARVDEYHAAIVGVEKEYRLSKIAKVSAFMYGQPRIKICYGDALVATHEAFPEIADGTFDLLVANPPFSVSGFLETLPDRERERYTLTQVVDDLDTFRAIETFFLERARQLLKPGGLAAIILPSSILSNGGSAYVRARALLLQSFDVVAISEFGPGTFGRTGTITVALFLRRKATGPETAEHYAERVAEWFKGDDNDRRKQVAYGDAGLIDRYAAHVGINAADYKTLLCGEPNAALLAHETFAAYRRAFDANVETKGLITKGWFKKLTEEAKQIELTRRFLTFAGGVERDKLLHFALADRQSGPVLIVRGPTETKDRRRFLGYEWSDGKGDEGIKLFQDAAGHHLTPLYDETDRDNPTKINHAIARHFVGELSAVPAGLESHVSLVPLANLLDFTRANFEKQIALSKRAAVNIATRWPTVAVSSVVEIISGGTPDTNAPAYWDGEIPWLSVGDFSNAVRFVSRAEKHISQVGLEKSNARLLEPGDIVISARGTVGAMAQVTRAMTFNQSCYGLRARNGASNDYVFYALKNEIAQLRSRATGSKFAAIIRQTFDEVKIPLPPADVQLAIVAECESVDAESANAQIEMEQARQEIAAKAQTMLSALHSSQPVESLFDSINGNATKIPENEIRAAGPVPVVTQQQGELISGYTEHTEVIDDVPLVVFGDHTCVFKYVDFPFVRGADGTQLLKFDATVMNPKFFGQIAPHLKIINSGRYERHFKYVKAMRVPVPPLPEQERFVAEVEVLENKIAAARAVLVNATARKEAILKAHL